MESFFTLRAEKQSHIINAALAVFGRSGYKKASANDIAADAGISKGMVFYYFGSKKALYLYLIEFCGNILFSVLSKSNVMEVTDFFDRIKTAAEIKRIVLKQHPAMFSFLKSAYYEDDKEVAGSISLLFEKNGGFRESLMYEGMDYSKFKDGVNPNLLTKFLVWASEGLAGSLHAGAGVVELDAFYEEFYECLDMMKNHFYNHKGSGDA